MSRRDTARHHQPQCTAAVVPLGAPVTALAASPTEPVAVAGLANGALVVVDLTSGAARAVGAARHPLVRSVQFAASGEWFVSTGKTRDGKEALACVWDTLGAGEPIFEVPRAPVFPPATNIMKGGLALTLFWSVLDPRARRVGGGHGLLRYCPGRHRPGDGVRRGRGARVRTAVPVTVTSLIAQRPVAPRAPFLFNAIAPCGT